MALTKTYVTILAPVSVAAGSSKASPGSMSATISLGTYYDGDVTWKITNGATAPGVVLSLAFQVSHDGVSWYDFYTVGGDTVNGSVNSGVLKLDKGLMNLRVIAYGNTLNAVTVEAYLQAVTGL